MGESIAVQEMDLYGYLKTKYSHSWMGEYDCNVEMILGWEGHGSSRRGYYLLIL
jgi:hypothetical protein